MPKSSKRNKNTDSVWNGVVICRSHDRKMLRILFANKHITEDVIDMYYKPVEAIDPGDLVSVELKQGLGTIRKVK